MVKTYQNLQLPGSEKIKDTFDKINTNSDNLNTDLNTIIDTYDNHIEGSADLHNASKIVNDSLVPGQKVSDALNSVKSQMDALVVGAGGLAGVYSINVVGTNTLTGSYTGLTYNTGMKANIKAQNDNTGAVTVNFNSLGAKNLYKIVKNVKTALSPRDLRQGEIGQIEYDGTDFILLNAEREAEYSTATTETKEIISIGSNSVGGKLSATIKGNTVVNLLSDDVAGCEATTGWSGTRVALATDTSNKLEGTNCIKFTRDAVSTSGYMQRDLIGLIDKTKYYLLSANVKNFNLATGIALGLITDDQIISSNNSTATSYTRIGVIIQPTDIDTATYAYCRIIGTGADTQYGFVDAIQLQEISSSEYALGADALLQKYTYHRGTKSTDKSRVKVTGKNLLNFDSSNWEQGTVDGTLGNLLGSTTRVRTKKLIKIKPNTQYSFNNYVFGGATYEVRLLRFLDKTFSVVGLPYANSPTSPITSPSTAQYLMVVLRKTNDSTFNLTELQDVKIQLELGSTATTYEPYTETQATCPVELHSVPAIQDEWDINTGKITKNVMEYTLLSGDITAVGTSLTNVDYVKILKKTDYSGYNNITSGLNILIPSKITTTDGFGVLDSTSKINTVTPNADTDEILLVVAKGTYADLAAAKTALAGTVIYYQLATPTYSYTQPAIITAHANGTVYNEAYVGEDETAQFYNAGLVLDSAYPLASLNDIDEINKYDLNTGIVTPIAISSLTLASSTSITISGALTSDFYAISYNYNNLSTIGTVEYSYSTNLNAQIKDNAGSVELLQIENKNLRTMLETKATKKKFYKVSGLDISTVVSSGSGTYEKRIPLGTVAEYCFITLSSTVDSGKLNILKTAEELISDTGYQFEVVSGNYNTNGSSWVISSAHIDGSDVVLTWTEYGAPSNMTLKIAWDIRAYGV